MQVVLQDLRFDFRQIIRNPGFSLTAVLSLTLGIGATVAVYGILNGCCAPSLAVRRDRADLRRLAHGQRRP
jgi:hypothetical protein